MRTLTRFLKSVLQCHSIGIGSIYEVDRKTNLTDISLVLKTSPYTDDKKTNLYNTVVCDSVFLSVCSLTSLSVSLILDGNFCRLTLVSMEMVRPLQFHNFYKGEDNTKEP